MMHYFMNISEAPRLVIQAGALVKGAEIFIFDIGEPVKIVDFAKNLIKWSGYTAGEIGIEFTGNWPGKKMFEELLKENEVYLEQEGSEDSYWEGDTDQAKRIAVVYGTVF